MKPHIYSRYLSHLFVANILGNGAAKCNNKVLDKIMKGITPHVISDLACRAGVKLESTVLNRIYYKTLCVLKVYLEKVIRDAVTHRQQAKGKTVTDKDVEVAMNNLGKDWGLRSDQQSKKQKGFLSNVVMNLFKN